MKTGHLMKIIGINLMICALVVGLCLPSSAAEKKPYKVGVCASLTGPIAAFGTIVKNGLTLETERVNAQGGINGRPLELVFEDDATDITKMAGAARKFGKNPDFIAMIGPMWSVATSTVVPIVEKEKIPQLTIWAPSAEERRMKPKWVFNIPQGDIILGERLMDLIMARGYKKVYAFCDRDPIWNATMVKETMKPIADKNGIQIIISKEAYNSTDTDMTPQVLKIKDELKTCDAIFLGSSGSNGSVVRRNLLSQGIKLPVIGTHGWGFGFTLDVGKEAVEGAEFVAGKAVVAYELDDNDPQKAVIVDFDKRMKARWNMPAEQIAAHCYDAIWILAEALKRAGDNPSRAQVRDEIEKTKNFIGCTGIFNYSPTNHQGLTKKAFAFVKIENNKFVRIKLPKYE
jgi:branched-chain amino acid transport system substrate-binding protein